ncbi:MAG: carbohydrate ABC transporter permease [Candidatus Ozemobacteraceae bacterium]
MNEEQVKRLLILAGSLLLSLFALGPFVWLLIISVADRPDFLASGNFSVSLKNYVDVLTSPSLHFSDYAWNSLSVAFGTSLLVNLFALPAAYAISRLRFPGRIVIPIIILAVSMFPQISIVGYLFELFSRLHMINSKIGLIFPYIAWTIPLALWINLSYMQQIPEDLDKAGLVDGASRWKILSKIIVPIALPGIFSAFLLTFIACFNEFLFALMLSIDYTAQTLPVGIALFEGLHGEIPWGYLMAASALASLPLIALTLVFQKYIIGGLMGGAVKG